MDILFTFAGNRDPFNPEVVKGVFTDGPVLTLLAERSFHAIHIFTNPSSLPNAQQLQQEIAKRDGDVRTRTLKELALVLKTMPRLDDDDKFAADVEDIITNQKTPAQVLLELSGLWEDDRTAEQIIADLKQSRK